MICDMKFDDKYGRHYAVEARENIVYFEVFIGAVGREDHKVLRRGSIEFRGPSLANLWVNKLSERLALPADLVSE